MTIINGQNAIFLATMGEQTIDKSIEYRWMNYVSFEMVDNERLILLNNLTRELLFLEQNEYSVSPAGAYSVTGEIRKILINKWFIVPIDYNEYKLSKEIRVLARQIENNQKEIISYVIFTTTACNARCFYCFEAGAKVVTMSNETAIAVAEYIIRHSNGKKVNITWFGGEPLCNTNAIDVICEKLRNANVGYVSRMVTNGYLFNDKIINKAISLWNLKHVQITLDGLDETYNRVKAYVNSVNNPFQHVVSNIKKLLKAGPIVRIRLNMDMHNEKELYSLVDYLIDKFCSYNNFCIYSNLIYEDVGFKKISHNNIERALLGKKHLQLQSYINDKGFLRSTGVSNLITTFACNADRNNAVLVSADGKLGNCERHVEDDFFGSVFNDDLVKPWTDYISEKDDCLTCEVYPVCIRPKRCRSNWEVAPVEDCLRRKWELHNSMLVSYKNHNDHIK